ncbi:hypothetical protein ScalyP_jg3966, partial [Parmales sp. scaly parma]
GGGGGVPYEIFPSYEHVSDLLGEDVFFIGSSSLGENSYAHHGDDSLGVAVVDRFTRQLVKFVSETRSDMYFESSQFYNSGNGPSLKDLVESFSPRQLRAHVSVTSTAGVKGNLDGG